jgi:glucuronate isomerase
MGKTQAKTSFIQENFLLQNSYAQKLYHDYAAPLPIIDYHNHLSAKLLAENHCFENITAAWLNDDHYKWRAMRSFGIRENYITGETSAREKFDKWATVVPHTLRNPLFHWTQLELNRYFGINEYLGPETADLVFTKTTEQLQQPTHHARGLMEMMRVEVACTTDDPLDTLEHHQEFRKQEHQMLLLPAFRPDKAYAVEDPKAYVVYLQQLENVSGIALNSFTDLLVALDHRIDYFHLNHCRLADHGLEFLPYAEGISFDIDVIFKKLWNQEGLYEDEAAYFKFEVLKHLCRSYHQHGWVQQFHLGAIRNTNQRMMQNLGRDSGFDSIGDYLQASSMAKFLSSLDATDQLAKTIIYNLNPADNAVFASMCGNFNNSGIKGKVQWGSAWWYLDQKDGMEEQLNTLSNMGLLSCFVGMLTDSRSFLSFPRHEYFRRILCNLIGRDVEQGLLPKDEKWLGKMVADICYHNAKGYFNFQ